MADNVLRTSADDLYELVRSRKKISVEEAAKILKMPNNTVQALVDFLVEEKIFGIEYKFTTPYIYVSKDITQEKAKIDATKSVEKKLISKDEFFKKAGRWNLPTEKINDLWKKYVEENINSIRNDFYTKADLRNLQKEKIDILWKKYLTYLM